LTRQSQYLGSDSIQKKIEGRKKKDTEEKNEERKNEERDKTDLNTGMLIFHLNKSTWTFCLLVRLPLLPSWEFNEGPLEKEKEESRQEI